MSFTPYLIRNLIGEAFPPYFTYLHGQVLAKLLSSGRAVPSEHEVVRPEVSRPEKVLLPA